MELTEAIKFLKSDLINIRSNEVREAIGVVLDVLSDIPKAKEIDGESLVNKIRTFNNVEFSSDGNPLYSYEQMIEIAEWQQSQQLYTKEQINNLLEQFNEVAGFPFDSTGIEEFTNENLK